MKWIEMIYFISHGDNCFSSWPIWSWNSLVKQIVVEVKSKAFHLINFLHPTVLNTPLQCCIPCCLVVFFWAWYLHASSPAPTASLLKIFFLFIHCILSTYSNARVNNYLCFFFPHALTNSGILPESASPSSCDFNF